MNHIKINHDLFHSHRFSHPVLQLCVPVCAGIGSMDGEISKPEAMTILKIALITVGVVVLILLGAYLWAKKIEKDLFGRD